jgi:hypothetical protein
MSHICIIAVTTALDHLTNVQRQTDIQPTTVDLVSHIALGSHWLVLDHLINQPLARATLGGLYHCYRPCVMLGTVLQATVVSMCIIKCATRRDGLANMSQPPPPHTHTPGKTKGAAPHKSAVCTSYHRSRNTQQPQPSKWRSFWLAALPYTIKVSGGVPSCERFLRQCMCSLSVGNASVVWRTCLYVTYHPPSPRGIQWSLCLASDKSDTRIHARIHPVYCTVQYSDDIKAKTATELTVQLLSR